MYVYYLSVVRRALKLLPSSKRNYSWYCLLPNRGLRKSLVSCTVCESSPCCGSAVAPWHFSTGICNTSWATASGAEGVYGCCWGRGRGWPGWRARIKVVWSKFATTECAAEGKVDAMKTVCIVSLMFPFATLIVESLSLLSHNVHNVSGWRGVWALQFS